MEGSIFNLSYAPRFDDRFNAMETFEVRLAAHPHDAFFKETFSDIAMASAFFSEHLPPALVSHVDWASLHQVPGSFVSQALQQLHSDLLFSVKAEGGDCLLYLLFEHQTTVDKHMPLRLLNYTTEVLLRHLETEDTPLPPVLPVLFHQGPDRWTVSPCFEDLFHIPGRLRDVLLPYLPKFRHALVDLSVMDPRNSVRDGCLRMAMEGMKRARMQQAEDYFVWLCDQNLPPDQLLTNILQYMFHIDQTLDVEAVAIKLESNPSLQQRIMSTAAALKAEGKAEGEASGAAKAKLTIFQNLMGQPVSTNEELAKLDLIEIEHRYQVLQREYDQKYKK